MNIRHFLRYLCVFVALLTLGGCSARSDSGASVTLRDFRCEITGSEEEEKITAVIESNGEDIVIRYLSPSGLQGICATYQSGEWSVTLGECVIKDEHTAVTLMQPALLLTAACGTPESLQKDEEGHTVRRYSDERYIKTDAEGVPMAFGDGSHAWEISWWESEKEGEK